ncbi:MAG: glycerol-3-phosphate responsive antiterminator [Enterocloster sp.]
MVHVDLITGLSGKESGCGLHQRTIPVADGIISTKPALIKRARELSLYTTRCGYSYWIPWLLKTSRNR